MGKLTDWCAATARASPNAGHHTKHPLVSLAVGHSAI